MMKPEIEPPQFRGYLAIYANGWVKSYLDRGSRRFLSLANPGVRRFVLAAIFTYTAKQESRLEFVAGSLRRAFRRIFITTGFPYVSFSPNGKGVYKCLHLFAGRIALQPENQLLIRIGTLDSDHYEVCKIAAIDPSQVVLDPNAVSTRVAQLCASVEAGDGAEHAALDHSLRLLDKIATTAEDKNSLRQDRIALNARFLVNHRASHKDLKLWTAYEKANGRVEAITDFNAEIARLTHPLALGRHGYNPSFKYLDLDLVAAELSDLMRHLATLGGQPFLNSGTLLGYYRDGRPILHDDDFDLGIFLSGTTKAEVFANWHRFVAAVKDNYAVVNKGSFLSVRLSMGVQVDLFAAWVLDGKVYVFPYCYGECDEAALLPLKNLDISGQGLAAPALPEALLAVNYGPNWRVPDPFWRFDYRKAKQRFSAAMKAMKTR